MPADFYLKRGDTLPRLSAHLKRGDGQAVDLTLATGVTFKMRKIGSEATKVSAPATILTAAAGLVEYAWQAADTDEPGQFESEWVVDIGGAVQRVPNAGFFTITILDGIG